MSSTDQQRKKNTERSGGHSRGDRSHNKKQIQGTPEETEPQRPDKKTKR